MFDALGRLIAAAILLAGLAQLPLNGLFGLIVPFTTGILHALMVVVVVTGGCVVLGIVVGKFLNATSYEAATTR